MAAEVEQVSVVCNLGRRTSIAVARSPFNLTAPSFGRVLSSTQLERARRLLLALQDHIRDTLIASRPRHAQRYAQIVAVTAADTIYQVDKLSENAILTWFEKHWPQHWPLELVMEGLEDHGPVTFPAGTPVARTWLKCIIDPIDGTRGLMYDKRSAWILAGLAPQRGARTHVGDIVVAAMTELPTSKQGQADQLSAVHGGGLRATRRDLQTGRRTSLRLRPSQANNFEHGYASFVRFFPEGKTLISAFEESLWTALHGGRSPVIFEDQYISSGGQLYELIAGHDRMIADLRPLVFKKLGLDTALTCHPYDICTALLLTEAGGVVETPEGKPLRAPLDTTSPVAWIGYANAQLARQVRPVLRRLIGEQLT